MLVLTKKNLYFMSQYTEQAEQFLKNTATKFKAEFVKHDTYFPTDKESRDIYKCTLKNKNGKASFMFGQSIASQGAAPTAYDLLACLTKRDPESFENFCSEYGYDTDSRTAERIYKACVKEFEKVFKLFNLEEIEALQEIQ